MGIKAGPISSAGGGGGGESNTIGTDGAGGTNIFGIPSKTGVQLKVIQMLQAGQISFSLAANVLTIGFDNLPVLGTLPASPRQTAIVNAEISTVDTSKITTGLLANARIANFPVLGTNPASPRQTAILNAEISTVDTSKITTGTMATARLGSGVADATTFLRGDQTYAVPSGSGLTFAKVVKPDDEDITEDTVLSDDTDLKVTLSINKEYHFHCIIYMSTTQAADFKWQFSVPAGATGSRLDGNWNIQSFNAGGDIALLESMTFFGSDNSIQTMSIHGVVSMGGTGGDLVLTWAQLNSSTTTTSIKKGSLLIVWEE